MYVRLQSKYKTKDLFVASDKHLGRIDTVKARLDVDTNVLSTSLKKKEKVSHSNWTTRSSR